MRRAHEGTQGAATFALLDEDGDVIERTQIAFELRKLTPESVLLMLQKLLDARDTWEENARLKHEAPLGLSDRTDPTDQSDRSD